MNQTLNKKDISNKINSQKNNQGNKKPTSKQEALKNSFIGKYWKWFIWLIVIAVIIVIIWALFFRSTAKYINTQVFISDINEVITKNDLEKNPDTDQWPANTKYRLDDIEFSIDGNNNWVVTVKNLILDGKNQGEVYTRMNYDDGKYYSSHNEEPKPPSNFNNFTYQFESYFLNINNDNKTSNNALYQSQQYTNPPWGIYRLLNANIAKSSDTGTILQIVFSIIPIIIIIVIFWFLYRSFSSKGGVGGLGGLPFKKTAIKPITSDTKFRDVAGYSEEKFELEEVLDFLKRPKAYISSGVRIPKGILLVGAPGTGKTLLAQAVAGEADVPFLKINGSEFVELFVGIGAQRVRDLFNTAKKYEPCILFIDEIDTIGRKRGGGIGGSNDEREQTLNQLLVELDGFSKRHSVIVIGATNRYDVLDPALLRPGRFDRIIQFHNPNKDERLAILKVHARNKNIDPDVDFNEIAKRTPGFTGAQLENVLNEAALLSIRDHEKAISLHHIDEAIDRVIGGLAKKTKKYIIKEKKIVAYHESGHAVSGLVLDGADQVQKITIIPRGQAGGYTLSTPKEERFFTTKKEIFEKIIAYLSGRAAEEIIFSEIEITTGAHNDIEQATILARKMVTELGMTELGLAKYDNLIDPGSSMYGYPTVVSISDELRAKIDEKIKSILDDCYVKAKAIINKHRELLELLAQGLIQREVLTATDIDYIYKNLKLPEWKATDLSEKEDLAKIKKKTKVKKSIDINPDV